MRVGGVDPSLTATGVAVVTHGVAGDGSAYATADTVPSIGHRGDNLGLRDARLAGVVTAVVDFLGEPDLVVVEAVPPPGPMAKSGSASYMDRVGLFWLIARAFGARRVPVAEVSPAGRMMYQTGRGGRPPNVTAAQWKAECLAATRARYPWVTVANDNEADALALATMGARYLGHPLENGPLPATNLRGLAKVAWPDLISV